MKQLILGKQEVEEKGESLVGEVLLYSSHSRKLGQDAKNNSIQHHYPFFYSVMTVACNQSSS